ncbi:Cell cycle checkpoint control protein RAD9A [Vanrija pseudolonga]|uniref:Cell cycle checkpoint control protein RAD9A n=1 Tax=Vanrija pseudolonga TaxID=143232 RepID=A0AAF0Y3S7_9TREE|nr:Cell cycle checkpoint control protein RAD9A [Vanrija pseudolonga]
MEASIKGDNIKNFVRLLQCAARYGDELCMHANKEIWELAVTNSSKSAFSLVTLQPAFFSKYRPLGNAAEQRRGVKCQLYVKSIISVLGKASAVKEVERLDLKIHDPDGGLRAPADDEDEDDDIRVNHRSAQLELKLVYRHGITKKHFLHLQASDFLRAIVDPDTTPSGFQIAAKTLRDWFDHFTLAFTAPASNNTANVRGDTQLAWMLSENEVRVKNLNGLATNALSTEITLDVAEFTNYEVVGGNGRVDLTLPMKEFKATLQLAEQFGMDLDFFFSEATQPMTISSTCYGADKFGNNKLLFTIFFVIATSPCDEFASLTSTPANGSVKRKRESASVTVKTDVDAQSRMGSVRPRPSSSRPRTSLSLTVEPPDRGPSQVSLRGANGLASQSQRTHAAEPLFLPGPSQSMSQRMSQQEALEAAGMDDVDLEAMMEDAEAEVLDDLGLDDDEDHAPADWSDVGDATFAAGLNAAQMSTPRDAFRPAAESQTLRAPSQRVPSPVRPPSGQPPQRRSASPVKPPPPPQRRSTSPTKAVVDNNPAPPRAPPRGRSEAPSRDRSGSRSRSRPRSDEELGDDDDDDVPALGPTQAGGANRSYGRQFESFFDDD